MTFCTSKETNATKIFTDGYKNASWPRKSLPHYKMIYTTRFLMQPCFQISQYYPIIFIAMQLNFNMDMFGSTPLYI